MFMTNEISDILTNTKLKFTLVHVQFHCNIPCVPVNCHLTGLCNRNIHIFSVQNTDKYLFIYLNNVIVVHAIER